MSWTWQFLDENGCAVTPSDPDLVPEPFNNQSDAETWIGANYPDLLDSGVWQVNLLNDSQLVYGPMGLDAQ